jgi:hypothetical protein
MPVLNRWLFCGLVICLLGIVGSLIWGYVWWPFVLVGCILGIATGVVLARAGLRGPLPDRSHADD